MKKELELEKHYYLENGKVVFTALYHSQRGSCCGKSCRHCPYTKPIKKGNKILEDSKK